jgi:predicted transposase YbfD/YdcC
MSKYENPLHIVSAQISALGLTFGQEFVEGKSNEIPATQRLIKMLKLENCVVVADALNCQKETANAVVERGGDYLLCVKDNHPALRQEIADFVHDEQLKSEMDTEFKREKNRDRVEKRTAFTSTDVNWIYEKEKWKNLCCIGAIHTEFMTKNENIY